MCTGNLTFAEFDKLIDDWIREIDDLEDTFQFQAKETGKLVFATEANKEKILNMENKHNEALHINHLLECDLHYAKELIKYVENAILILENRINMMDCQNLTIDGFRQQIYPLFEDIFSKFSYSKDVIDMVYDEHSKQGNLTPMSRLSRLLSMEWIVLEHIEKKLNKMDRYLNKIECQKKYIPQIKM